MVKTQDEGAAKALDAMMGEPQRQAEHTARVNGELARSLRNAAEAAVIQQRTIQRGRDAAEAAAIGRHELLK